MPNLIGGAGPVFCGCSGCIKADVCCNADNDGIGGGGLLKVGCPPPGKPTGGPGRKPFGAAVFCGMRAGGRRALID